MELNKEALKFGEYWAYYEGMAKALTRMKRYEEALDIYRKALKLRPHSESMNFACGNLARRFKLYSEAQTCYERAITMNPKKEIYYAQLSYLGRDIGNQEMQQKNLRKYYEVKLRKQGMEGTVTNVFSSPKK